MSGAPPFTPATAPRAGGKAGRKVKLSAHALEILDRLLVDWAKHGAATLKVLRLENPAAYARLSLEVATKVALNESAVDDGRPMMLVVRWGTRDPSKPMPLPPDPIPSEPPPRGPMQMPRLLSFERPLDQ